jgi:hypothetical protein
MQHRCDQGQPLAALFFDLPPGSPAVNDSGPHRREAVAASRYVVSDKDGIARERNTAAGLTTLVRRE